MRITLLALVLSGCVDLPEYPDAGRPPEDVLVTRCKEVGAEFCRVEAECRNISAETCVALWAYAHCSDWHAAPDMTQPEADTCAATWVGRDCYSNIIQRGWNEETAPLCYTP